MNRAMRSAGLRRRASPATARTVAAVVAAACVGLLAACGGSIPSSSGVATLPSPSAAASATTQAGTTGVPSAGDVIARAVTYAQCMRTNGVPSWPDPNARGVFDKTKITTQHLGVSDSLLQAAQAACHDLLPSGGSNSRGPTPAEVQQALQFSRCMRGHGVPNFPDPDGTGRIPDPASFGIDQGAPQFQAANQACGAYRPPYMPSNDQYSTFASSQP